MMDTDLGEMEGQGHDNQIISIIFEALYYFCAFADLGHIGITSFCRNENCFHTDIKVISALDVTKNSLNELNRFVYYICTVIITVIIRPH